MKTMAETLAEHWSASSHTDSAPPVDKCDGCGAVLRIWGDDNDMPARLAAHQAEALAASGYGPVRESHEAAWDEGYDRAESDHYGTGFWTKRLRGNPYRAAS